MRTLDPVVRRLRRHALRASRLAGALLVTAAVASSTAVATAAAGDAEKRPARDLERDLFGVISIEGLPCGEVVEAERLGENDYLATCATGDRYRVRVTPEGRVTVERR